MDTATRKPPPRVLYRSDEAKVADACFASGRISELLCWAERDPLWMTRARLLTYLHEISDDLRAGLMLSHDQPTPTA